MQEKILTNEDVLFLAGKVAHLIGLTFEVAATSRKIKVYGIPRGGIPAMYAVIANCNYLGAMMSVNDPEDADLFIDDIIDSGETMRKFCDQHPGKPFFALIDKTDPNCQFMDDWIVFPWERQDKSEDDSIVGTLTNRIKDSGKPFFANDNISEFFHDGELKTLQAEVEKRYQHFLEALIIDVNNDHNTEGTAHRVAKMCLHEVFKGRYLPAPKITDFPNAKGLDEMYMMGPITVRSACSHHFVPITGRCWIGIVPGNRVIGLSKFNRIVDWIASRPQIQEELVVQIADFIEEQISPKGLAIVIEATHNCMTWRGVKEPMEAKMTTNVMRGVFRDKPEARAEFMTLVAK